MSEIRASTKKIKDKIVASKVLKNVLPIYAIRISAIQETRCNPKHDITLDALVAGITLRNTPLGKNIKFWQIKY